MIYFLFLFLYRISETYGGYLRLPRLESQTEFDEFIKHPNYSVVIFTNDTENAYFANYAIFQLSKSIISFGTANEDQGKKYNCYHFPCSIPFKNGKQVLNYVEYPAPTQASLFYSWCVDILNSPFRKIQNPQQLIHLLGLSNITCAIGVDSPELPSNLPENLSFYNSSSKFFSEINMTVSKGLYIFNGADRSLNLVTNGNFDEFLHSQIISIDKVDFSKKKYVAGFYFNSSITSFGNNSDIISAEENKMKILKEIASKDEFSQNFFFSPFNDDVIFQNKLQFRETPLFIVLEQNPNSNSTLRHWTVSGIEKVLNIDFLLGFLRSIQKEELNFSPLDQKGDTFPYPHNDTHVISYSEFSEKVNQDIDVIAICYSDFDKYILMRTAVQVVVEHFNTSNITFVCLNLTCNDVPDKINVLPPGGIFLFPKGQKDSPVPYMFKRYQFFDVLNFIKRHSLIKYDIPPFNNMEKEQDIVLSRISLHNLTKV